MIGWAGSVGKWYPTVQKAKPKEVKPCFSAERRVNEGLRKYVVSDEVASQVRCSAQREEPYDREQGAGNEQ